MPSEAQRCGQTLRLGRRSNASRITSDTPHWRASASIWRFSYQVSGSLTVQR